MKNKINIKEQEIHSGEFIKGIIYSFLSFFIWGLLPTYWKLLKDHVSPFEILLHRIIWSFIFLIFINLIIKSKKIFNYLKDRKTRYALLTSGLLIGINWFLYIYAINTDRVVESSLGYYINPLISVLFGLIFLRERLDKFQWLALFLAFTGVLILTIKYGKLPWISLMLASSFALYGLMKKIFKYDSLSGITIETLFLFPFALMFLIKDYIYMNHNFFNRPFVIYFLLLFAGVVTVLPLLFFAMGTKRIPLSNVGFIQYTSPTLMLLQGIFIYKESFSLTHLTSFCFIWLALIIYTITLFFKKEEVTELI